MSMFTVISTNEYVGNALLFVGALMIALAIPSPITRGTATWLGALGVLICLFGFYWRMDTAHRSRMKAFLRRKLRLSARANDSSHVGGDVDVGEAATMMQRLWRQNHPREGAALAQEYEERAARVENHPGNPKWLGLYTQGLVKRLEPYEREVLETGYTENYGEQVSALWRKAVINDQQRRKLMGRINSLAQGDLAPFPM